MLRIGILAVLSVLIGTPATSPEAAINQVLIDYNSSVLIETSYIHNRIVDLLLKSNDPWTEQYNDDLLKEISSETQRLGFRYVTLHYSIMDLKSHSVLPVLAISTPDTGVSLLPSFTIGPYSAELQNIRQAMNPKIVEDGLQVPKPSGVYIPWSSERRAI